MQRDPEERISAADAMTHPWLKQHCLDLPEDGAECLDMHKALIRLRSFSSTPALQKLLLLLHAQRFGVERGDQASCFRLYDWLVRTLHSCTFRVQEEWVQGLNSTAIAHYGDAACRVWHYHQYASSGAQDFKVSVRSRRQ